MKRLLIIPVILVAAACGSGTATTAPGSPATSSAASASVAVAVPVVVKDFSLDPGAITVHGSPFSLAVSNAGPTVHNVTVRDADGVVLGATRDLREGEA
jgi:hypothetical protein